MMKKIDWKGAVTIKWKDLTPRERAIMIFSTIAGALGILIPIALSGLP